MKRTVEVFSIIVVLLTSVRWAPAIEIRKEKTYTTDGQGRWHQRWVDQNGQHDRIATMYNVDTGKYEDQRGRPNLGPMTAGEAAREMNRERISSKSSALRPKPTESPSNAAPKSAKLKSTESPSDSISKSGSRFDGTWVAKNYKNNPAGGKISGVYTIVIKDGKTADKILDTTNVSSPESADYEVHRKWTCNSTDLRASSSSLTIQWSAGQLIDWAPRTISREEIEGYGSPNAETSVYRLKGDELTRINDPNGVTYHRAK